MRRVILESPFAKRCSRCKQVHPLEFFNRDKCRADGRHPWCKSCSRENSAYQRTRPEYREQQRARDRVYRRQPLVRAKALAYQKTEQGKAAKRRCKLKTKYGLTVEDVAAMMDAQGGRCAACRSEFKSTKHTHIDHCHETAKVRGILCNDCNRALGAVKDSTATLAALIGYLEATGCEG